MKIRESSSVALRTCSHPSGLWHVWTDKWAVEVFGKVQEDVEMFNEGWRRFLASSDAVIATSAPLALTV